MGLYPRYAGLRQDGKGEWFAACADDGRLVGLATARYVDPSCVQVDGFTQPSFQGAWSELVHQTVQWSRTQGTDRAIACVAVKDKEKQELFESLRFSRVATGETFDIGPNRLDGVRLEKGFSSADSPQSAAGMSKKS